MFPYGAKDPDELRERIRADRRAAARPRRQAAGDRLQHGDLGRRGRGPRGRRGARGGGGAGGRAAGRDRRGDHRQRAGSGCWRRRTRSRAAPTAAPSKPRAAALEVTEVAAPDLAPFIQDGSPFDEEHDDDGALLLRAAEAGRGRHPDPRLHPLPAGGADAAADPRPRRPPGQRRPRRRRRRPAHARGAPASPASATARATTTSSAPATPSPSATSAPASCRCRWARSSGSRSPEYASRAKSARNWLDLRATRAPRPLTICAMPVLTAGNTVYTHPVAKVMISIPDKLLERLDARAQASTGDPQRFPAAPRRARAGGRRAAPAEEINGCWMRSGSRSRPIGPSCATWPS